MAEAGRTRVAWGVLLSGEAFDLQDWQKALKRPFDPWVSETDDGLILRSSLLGGPRDPQSTLKVSADTTATMTTTRGDAPLPLSSAMWSLPSPRDFNVVPSSIRYMPRKPTEEREEGRRSAPSCGHLVPPAALVGELN